MNRRIIAVVAALVAATPAPAQDDIVDRIISVPVPSEYEVQGVRNARVRDDDGVQGGHALRVPVPRASDQAWDVQVSIPINRAVSAGDELVLAFWARLEEGESETATLPFNAVQLAAEPYTALFSGPATIGPDWAIHEIRGRADRDYGEDALTVSLHLATGRQTVDIGPVFVLNMRQ